MSARHNLKFVEAAILRLQAQLASEIASLEGLLKDPSASTHHPDLVDTICEIADRCVSVTGAIAMLQKSIGILPTAAATPPATPPLTEKDLKERSAAFRKSIGDAPTPPPKKKKRKT